MRKLGTVEPRSLESFGVSGVLGEDCQVFYDSLFTTKHIGRISDLLSARLQSSTMDELRLRSLILFSLMKSYRVQSNGKEWGTSTEEVLKEPMVLEVGIDAEKLAIGVSFAVQSDGYVQPKGLLDRLKKGQPSNEFEKILLQTAEFSDRVVLRFQPSISRIEIISLVGLPNITDRSQVSLPDRFHYIEFQTAPDHTPKPKSYVELGDLDYLKLLKEDDSFGKHQPSATGKLLADQLQAGRSGATKEEVEALYDPSKEDKDEAKDSKPDKVTVRSKDRKDDDAKEKEAIKFAQSDAEKEAAAKAREKIVIKASEDEKADSEDDQVKEKNKNPNKVFDDEEIVIKGAKSNTATSANEAIKVKGQKLGEVENEELRFSKERQIAQSDAQKVKGGKNAVAQEEEEKHFDGEPSLNDKSKVKVQEGEDAGTDDEEDGDLKLKRRRRKKANASDSSEDEDLDEDGDDEGSDDGSKKTRVKSTAESQDTDDEEDEEDEDDDEADEDDDEDEEGEKTSVLGKLFGKKKLRKIWPFGKKQEEEEEDEEEDDDEDEEDSEEDSEDEDEDEDQVDGPQSSSANRKMAQQTVEMEEEASDPSKPSAPHGDPKELAKNLELMLEAGELPKVVENATKTFEQIKAEAPPKMRKFMDGFLGDLTREKAKLVELSRQLSRAARQREIDFHNKERVLEEELKRRDEAMKSKDRDQQRMKDQLGQMTMNMERVRSAATSAAADAQYKKKFNHMKSVLTQNQDEATKLKRELEVVKTKLNSAMSDKTAQNVNELEHQTTKKNLERIQKLLDEQKKVALNHLQKFQDAESKAKVAQLKVDEFKVKMDQVGKLITERKTQLETAQKLAEAKEVENILLQKQVAELQKDIVKLKNPDQSDFKDPEEPTSSEGNAA